MEANIIKFKNSSNGKSPKYDHYRNFSEVETCNLYFTNIFNFYANPESYVFIPRIVALFCQEIISVLSLYGVTGTSSLQWRRQQLQNKRSLDIELDPRLNPNMFG